MALEIGIGRLYIDKNHIGLKNPLHWQNCEALFFENKLIGIFCSAAHCITVSQLVWLNWKLRILQHIFFWACYFFVLHQIFFFWSFFKTFWTCIVPCTLHISEQMLGNINWPKKTCDIIIHLVPRLTFRHIGDFHDTHMRSLPGNCD